MNRPENSGFRHAVQRAKRTGAHFLAPVAIANLANLFIGKFRHAVLFPARDQFGMSTHRILVTTQARFGVQTRTIAITTGGLATTLRVHISDVIGMSTQKNVGRVDAVPHVAAMADNHTLGYRAVREHVRNAVCLLLNASNGKATVTCGGEIASKQPAVAAPVGLRPERRLSVLYANIRPHLDLLVGVPCLGVFAHRRGFTMPNYSIGKG